VAGLVVNLLANAALIPAFGINGAALASTISYTLSAALTLVLYRRLSGQGVRQTLIVRRSDLVRLWARVKQAMSRVGSLRRPAATGR